MRSEPAWTRRSSWRAWCTISASSASSAPITATGAPRWSRPMSTKRSPGRSAPIRHCASTRTSRSVTPIPKSYIKNFGADYRPDPYIEEEYKRARDHKWYMTARMITVHDIYSFEPDVVVELEEFTDIIGRNFKQPKEGLGWDSSPSAHMWRRLVRPTRYFEGAGADGRRPDQPDHRRLCAGDAAGGRPGEAGRHRSDIGARQGRFLAGARRSAAPRAERSDRCRAARRRWPDICAA